MAKTDGNQAGGKKGSKDVERRLRSRIARQKHKIQSLDASEAPGDVRLARKRMKRAQRKLNRTRQEMARREAALKKAKARSDAAAGQAQGAAKESPSE